MYLENLLYIIEYEGSRHTHVKMQLILMSNLPQVVKKVPLHKL
jgi:hypothetical protein